MLEVHHQGAVGRGGDQKNGEQGEQKERCPSILCGYRIEEKAHVSNFITEHSFRGVWHKFLVHNHIPLSKLIWSNLFVIQLTHVIWLNSSSIDIVWWEQRCDSGQIGKQVRQGSRVPIVRGRGCVVVVNKTVLYPEPISQANILRVEEFHFSAGSHCKGSDLPPRRLNMKRGRSIQAGRKDLVVQAPPGDLVDPLVQESQGAPGFLTDSPLQVLLAQGVLWDLGFQHLDFLFLL